MADKKYTRTYEITKPASPFVGGNLFFSTTNNKGVIHQLGKPSSATCASLQHAVWSLLDGKKDITVIFSNAFGSSAVYIQVTIYSTYDIGDINLEVMPVGVRCNGMPVEYLHVKLVYNSAIKVD